MTAVVAVLLLAASATLQGGERAKKDEQRIVGTWAMVSGEKSGEKAPDEIVREFRLTLTADGKLTVKVEGQDHDGTYKLNDGKKPKEVDFTVDGKNMPGIYVFDGDNLKLCVADEGETRPTEFTTQAGVRTMMFVLKREKKE
jgi:uncharacterized protein (TIGR03067 family)